MLLNMKKPVLFILVAGAVLLGCRKKEFHEDLLRDENSFLPSHCFNDMMDGDELGTDCGGSCNDCEQIPEGCSLPLNEVAWADGFLLFNLTHWDTSTYMYGGDKYYEYIAHCGDDDSLQLVFFGKPSLTTHYNSWAYSTYSMDEDENCYAWFASNTLTSDYRVVNGQLFISYVDGKYTFTGCELDITYVGTVPPSYTTLSFRLQTD
jgi:hypothetical protein